MIELNTTWNTVTMLLIAAGVGLLGGIAAGLLEMQRAKKAAAGATSAVAAPSLDRRTFWSSVFLGGVAAVAILYFFPPQETVSVTIENAVATKTQYDLTKLVALALIVGSAGSSFLLVLQTRALALTSAAGAEATKATANEAIGGFKDQAPALAKANVEALAPAVQEALEDATMKSKAEISSDTVEELIGELATQTEAAMKDSIDPLVEGAQRTVLAASSPLPPPPQPNREG